ncbi:Guanylate cyclase [Aphelenchoides bicaudatus]|nr:Guanylate cyclase [Aphelenchoides bicaudatus]
MLGYIHICFKDMIIHNNGADVYQQILKQSGYEQDVEWDSKQVYSDQDTYRLFRMAATVLNLSLDAVWETFGTFFCNYVINHGWGSFLDSVADNLAEFLETLSSMHFFIDRIAFQSELRGPIFKCEQKPDGTLRLHYYSARKGLFPMAKTMIKQAAKVLFNLDVRMIVTERGHERRNELVTEHVIFTIESEDEFTSLTKCLSAREPTILKVRIKQVRSINFNFQAMPMNVSCFCAMFPTHVVFNKSLIIEHCGDFLQKEFSITRRRMCKVVDLLALLQPDDISFTFKNILSYLNSFFICSFKQQMARNENTKKMMFMLKGQMILVNGGNSLLYINSPYIFNPEIMLNNNLFISDMQNHDATREIIMLNQNRVTQQNINRQLDMTAKKLKQKSDKLEKIQQKMEQLATEKIPQTISTLMKNDGKVTARMHLTLKCKALKTHLGDFKSVTCLYADLPYFNVMIRECSPQGVFLVINELFRRFDRLIKMHSCFKLHTKPDSYIVVSGAPDYQIESVDQILNLALGMIFEAQQVVVPRLNLPVVVRIGINTGHAIGGLIETNMPRYAVFSNIIEFSQKLMQQTEPSTIIISNTTKLLASKSSRNDFVFTTNGYVKMGSNQATCTFFLESNAKKTLLEIHGYIHCCLETMVIRHNSLEAYKNLLRKAGLNEATQWKCRENYPDEMTFRLFHSYAAISQQTIEMILEQFGEYFFHVLVRTKIWIGFLDNLSSFHYFLDTVVFQAEAHGPSFRCEANQDGTLTLHYFSDRKSLYPMVKGLIKQAADDLFHQPIRIVVRERKQDKRRNIIMEHVIFSISPVNKNDKLTKTQTKSVILTNNRKKVTSSSQLTLASFCKAYPTHICFNKQLFIEHCGEFMQREFEVAAKRLVKISDILVLTQPDDVARNEGKITNPFMLKGQIHLLNNGEHLLFMASPYFSSVSELIDSNVFISDMQLNDATRDLILLNQNRISQQELNRKLEQTYENLHVLTAELEKQRKQLDTMQSDFLPPIVASRITDDYLPAGLFSKNNFKTCHSDEFTEVTFLHVEIAHFQLITAKLEPQELIDLMNQIFGAYDKLIDFYEASFLICLFVMCLKLHSLMDAYFVVCGAPISRSDHAEQILDLALAMIYTARKINVPKINLPLMLKIGVHSGSLIAMVVGSMSRLRYTAVSESVDIAKKLSSYSESGQILVSASTKALVSKSNLDSYGFQTFSYLKLGSNQAICTFWLEKSNSKSIFDLTGTQDDEQDFDWQQIERDQLAWANYYRQHLGLSSLHEKQGSAQLWRRLKRGVKSERSQDSGISYEAMSSSVCTIM